jgi:hypothetical protein
VDRGVLQPRAFTLELELSVSRAVRTATKTATNLVSVKSRQDQSAILRKLRRRYWRGSARFREDAFDEILHAAQSAFYKTARACNCVLAEPSICSIESWKRDQSRAARNSISLHQHLKHFVVV